MSSLHITKNDVNSVRVFVGVVSVLSLMTLPTALCFPNRSKKTVARVVEYAHPGMRPRKKKSKPRRVFTMEASDSSGDDLGAGAAEKNGKEESALTPSKEESPVAESV